MKARNRMRWASARFFIPVLAILAGLVGMASLASAGPDKAPSKGRPMLGCSKLVPGAGSQESQDLFDPESGQLVVSTPSADYLLSENDPECKANPEARGRLAEARSMANENHRAMCEDFNRYVAEGTTEVNGRPINLDAARQALQGGCVGWLR
ncbi:MAG: hypothetical protein LC750_09245 [Actinobacteria bacterium]|nr:hypothetical protein [Actinomycetota bacterium]